MNNINKNLVEEKNINKNKYTQIIKENNFELENLKKIIEKYDKKEKKKIKKKEDIFCGLIKKYNEKNLKENKLKMIIGIYLQKQNISFNQKIKEYKDKNKKLIKSVRKLNDQIIEYKLNKLNKKNNIDNKAEND